MVFENSYEDMLDQSGRTLKTLETGLGVIEAVKEHQGMTIGELVEEFDTATSTMHGYLSTLQKLGYIVKEEDRYFVGLRFLHLASFAKSRKPEYALARSAVNELGQQTNEEVDFDVEENGRIINVFNTHGVTQERSVSVNNYFYMHTTATGMAILAEWPRERVERVFDHWGLPRVTSQSVVDEEEILAELEETRERGFAINDQQHMQGIRSIGAAVTYPDESIFGGLSIAGPHYRMERSQMLNFYGPDLLDAARSLEADLVAELDDTVD